MLTSQLGSLLANVPGRDSTTCERSCPEQQCVLKWGSRSVVVELGYINYYSYYDVIASTFDMPYRSCICHMYDSEEMLGSV